MGKRICILFNFFLRFYLALFFYSSLAFAEEPPERSELKEKPIKAALESSTLYNSTQQWGTKADFYYLWTPQILTQGEFSHFQYDPILVPNLHRNRDVLSHGKALFEYREEGRSAWIGVRYGVMPIKESRVLGGILGGTYTKFFEDEDETENGLKKITFSGSFETSTLSTSLPAFQNSDLRKDSQLAYLFEVKFSLKSQWNFGGKARFYGYRNHSPLYESFLRQLTLTSTNLEGMTIQGVWDVSTALYVEYELGAQDRLRPQYLLTNLDRSHIYTHTAHITWSHRFNSGLKIDPSYELTVQRSRKFSGFILSISYCFY